MRRIHLVPIVAVAVLAGCAAPIRTVTPTPPSSSMSATPAAADPVADELDDLIRVLEQTHPEPYHSVAREEFRAALDGYAREVGDLSDGEAVVSLMRIWAMLSREGRDGHQFALPVERSRRADSSDPDHFSGRDPALAAALDALGGAGEYAPRGVGGAGRAPG